MPAITAATRPTRRDLWRHPWRTIAAVLLIAVPVALVVGFSLFQNSSTINTFLVSPERSVQVLPDQKNVTNADMPEAAAEFLPEGATLTPVTSYSNISITLGEHSTNSWISQFDAQNPPKKAQGIVDKLELGPNEIILTRSSAHQLGAEVGD